MTNWKSIEKERICKISIIYLHNLLLKTLTIFFLLIYSSPSIESVTSCVSSLSSSSTSSLPSSDGFSFLFFGGRPLPLFFKEGTNSPFKYLIILLQRSVFFTPTYLIPLDWAKEINSWTKYLSLRSL